MSKTERLRYTCPVLGGVALVHITTRYSRSDEMAQPIAHEPEFTDCDNKLQCGIAKQVSYGSWTFEWGQCPAFVGANRKP